MENHSLISNPILLIRIDSLAITSIFDIGSAINLNRLIWPLELPKKVAQGDKALNLVANSLTLITNTYQKEQALR